LNELALSADYDWPMTVTMTWYCDEDYDMMVGQMTVNDYDYIMGIDG